MFLVSTLIAASCLAPAPQPLAGGQASGVEPATAWWSSFPVPQSPFVIDAQDAPSVTMLDVVKAYSEATGQQIVISNEATQLLQSQGTGLLGAVTVEPDELQGFFEALLVAHDFALCLVRDESPRLLAIESLKTQARNTIRSSARFISVEHVGAMREHPAMLVTTIVTLPHTDVRQLSNAMRTMITDANTQQMLPAGNTNSMIVTGFGNSVAQVVQALRIIDADAQANWELTQKMQAAAKAQSAPPSGDVGSPPGTDVGKPQAHPPAAGKDGSKEE